jgi:hypothetical protein
MTGSVSPASPTFAEVARRVQHRLVIRKSLEFLLKTWPWAALAVGLLSTARLMGSAWITWDVVVTLLSVWLAGCLLLAVWGKADAYSALAFWDRAASRGDAFANAWWFEQQPRDKRSRGQEYHLTAQRAALPAALPRLHDDVALPKTRWRVLLPVGALALMLIPVHREGALPDPVLSDAARAVAKSEGQKLADKKLDSDKMNALTAQEKTELEKLQAKVQETAKALEQQEAKTARDVLGELERRAREAEELAKKLGAGDSAWASAQLVAEIRKHADTAALGDAVADKAPELTAKEAQAIADKLKSFELSIDMRDRFAEILREIGKHAQPEDKDRTVGQHVIAADHDMAQTLPQDAAKEFQALADKMRTLAAREKAREQLEKLAQQLRESGSNVAGEGTKGMQQLAGNQDQQSSQGAAGSKGQQGMMNLANAPQMPQMQMPGLSNGMQMQQGQQGQGQTQQGQMLTPSQNNGQGNKDGKSMAVVPSDGKSGPPKPNEPMLFAPIPGSDPNQPPDGAMLGLARGLNPAGSDPGNATSDPGKDPTEKIKASRGAQANVQRNADGSSTVRSIEGQTHNEQTARASQTTAIEAIAAEEGALDDVALPPARREQVRRYFNELRKKFEKEP